MKLLGKCLLVVVILNTVYQILNTPVYADWSMVAGNPQRTSWTPEEVSGNLVPIWYRPIEAYIPQNSQVIAASGMLYIATAKGLYALDANTGDIKWRYDSEMPFGDSPTYVNGVLYIGSLDKRLYAINAATGAKIWTFDGAKAGFSTNPLVLTNTGKPIIYIGNRDGTFYAVQDNGASSSLLWSFTTGGVINNSAAASANNSTIYFASNDNYAYALNSSTGVKVWQSAKLPTEGLDSFWPVVYHESSGNKDYVIFVGANPYRQGTSPGTTSITTTPADQNAAYNGVEKSDLNTNFGWTRLQTTTALSGNPWANPPGLPPKTIYDASSFVNYFAAKPWRRTTIILNSSDGSETVSAPFPFSGTRSGSRYPPIVGPDGTGGLSLYVNMFYDQPSVTSLEMGWKFGTQYFSDAGLNQASDEPPGYSMGGNVIYGNNCCDREARWKNALTGTSGVLWTYLKSLYPDNPPGPWPGQTPGYDEMWYLTHGGLDRLAAQYGGDSQYIYNRSAVYHNHGDGHPVIPYQGKIFSHQSNAIIVFGPQTAPIYGNKGALRINSTTDNTIPVLPSSVLSSRLDTEVKKIITSYNTTGKDLRIGYYNHGQAFLNELGNYFESPGDTLYTLSTAYPYLPPSTQSQLVPYLQHYYATFFNPTMYSSIGWDGTGREAYDIPPEVLTDMQSKPKKQVGSYNIPGYTSYGGLVYPQFGIYGLWKYVQNVSPADATTAYAQAKTTLNLPGNLLHASDTELTTFPWQLNDYIAGYIGFLNLQQLAGKTTTDAALRTTVTNELTRLKSLRASAINSYLSPGVVNNCLTFIGHDMHCWDMNVARNFLGMTPELGDYLNQNALPGVQAAITETTYVGPYWMQEGYNAALQEGAKENLYDVTVLLGKAYVLKQSYSELAKNIDAPQFAVGDLLYMNNLIAALSSTTITPPPPNPYDINKDGNIDILDLARIVNARTTVTIDPYSGPEDVNTDTKLNQADLDDFLRQYTRL